MTTLELYYEVHGPADDPKTPLVLIHGGAGSISGDWSAVLPLYSRDRRIVAVELQGHGHTPHADRPYSFESSADDVAAVVETLGLDQVDVLGFSNGGPTAMRLALRRPSLVRKVVVASGFARHDGMIDGFWSNFDDPQLESMPAELKAAYQAINPDPADLQRMFDLDVELMRGFHDWPESTLAALAQPCLFVGGDHDVVLPEHQLWMARAVADGRPLVLPAGHGDYLGMSMGEPVDMQLVEATWGLIAGFLDGA